jgi:hypothetical protein
MPSSIWSPSIPKRRPPKKTMKKVSKKGAYKKNVKNQMSIRRAPIVETKQRVASDIAIVNGFSPFEPGTPVHSDAYVQPVNYRPIVPADAFTLVPIDSFYRNSHGFEEYNCVGNSIFSKYLNTKIQFRFPQNTDISMPVPASEQPAPGAMYTVRNQMIEQPCKLYLICGWVTQAWNCPIEGSTNAVPLAGVRPQRDSATQAQLQDYIKLQLEPYFDDSTDKLMFREKVTSNIRIDKYVRIKPNLNHAIGTQAVPNQTVEDITTLNSQDAVTGLSPRTIVATGSIPDVMKTWSVKTNRKIALTEGTDASGPTDKQNLYPNHSWLPFMVIYNPDYLAQANNTILGGNPSYPDRFTQVQFIQYRFNDAHYFTDS